MVGTIKCLRQSTDCSQSLQYYWHPTWINHSQWTFTAQLLHWAITFNGRRWKSYVLWTIERGWISPQYNLGRITRDGYRNQVHLICIEFSRCIWDMSQINKAPRKQIYQEPEDPEWFLQIQEWFVFTIGAIPCSHNLVADILFLC